MDDKHSAMLWQLMQSMGAHTQEDSGAIAEPLPFEHNLMSLRPLMPPKQQKLLDLMIKMQEVKTLIHEIQTNT